MKLIAALVLLYGIAWILSIRIDYGTWPSTDVVTIPEE